MHEPALKRLLAGRLSHKYPEAYVKQEYFFNVPKNLSKKYRRKVDSGRVDILLVRKRLFTGYEIKSDYDNVKRLAEQDEKYKLALDKINLVTSEKQLGKALKVIPEYWGILIIDKTPSRVVFKRIRKAESLSCKKIEVIADRLWVADIKGALAYRNCKKYSTLTKNQLINKLREFYTDDEIVDLVISKMQKGIITLPKPRTLF